MFGPQIGLHAEHIAGIVAQAARQRVEAINILNANHPAPARRRVGGLGLPVVEIQRRRRRQHRVMPLGRRRQRALNAAPGHHGRAGGQVACHDLVPADHLFAVRRKIRLRALDKIVLHIVEFPQTQRPHARGHARRGLPLRLDHLVAAQMVILARKQAQHLIKHGFEELEGGLLQVENVIKDAPARRGRGNAKPLYPQFRVGGDGGAGMARHADFRHDGDKTLGRVGDDLAYLMPTVVTAVAPRRARGLVDIGRGRGAGRDPPRADLGQPGPAGNIQPPALIVGQMPVEHVHFVQRQPVDVAFDVGHRLHMPGRIEHQPAPLKTRPVDDAQRRDGPALGQQLRQGGEAVIQTGRGRGLDAYAGFIDPQFVGLAHPRAPRLGGHLPGRYDREA